MTLAARREKVSRPPKGQLRLEDANGLTGELWLVNRLTEWHSVPRDEIFGGDTDIETRRKRIHEAIERHGLEWVICGRDSNTRKCLTWGEVYTRLYGVKF